MSAPEPPPTIETLLAHRAWVRGLARSLVADESRADDVEQETWLAAMERPPSRAAAAAAWLRRVVRSRAVDAHRSDSRRAAREKTSARPEATPSADGLVAKAEIQRDVAAAVCALEEPYRTAVILRYFDELEPHEIAARLGVPVETVRTRLKRAHEQLRARLDREHGDRRAWSALLVPLARTASPVTVGAATGGVVVMAGTKKLVAAAVLLLLIGSGAATWMSARSASDDRSVAEAPSAAPAAATPRAAGPQAPRISLTGRVRSRQDGQPVAAALVTLEGEKGKRAGSTTTAADGTFRAESASVASVRVEAAGFRAATADVPRTSDATRDVGDVWLDAAQALVVEVLGAGDTPVADAEVRLVRRAHSGEVATTHSHLRAVADPDFRLTRVGAARTDASGVARFAGIAPGPHSLVVRCGGFATASVTYVDVAPGRPETRTTVRLAPAQRLTGRLVTSAGAPAPQWLVCAGGEGWDESAFVTTDDAGRFAFDDVPAGDVRLSAGRRRGTLPILATVRVPDISDIEVRLPAMGVVAGRVHLADDTPVADAEVGIETSLYPGRSADFFAHTDSDGRYHLDEVPAGPLDRFEVRHAGLCQRPADKRSAVIAGAETTIDVTMAPGAHLHGRVLSPDGPVGGAWVFVNIVPPRGDQSWETAVADAEGRYSFDFLRPGRAGVVPLHPAYAHPDAPPRIDDALFAGRLAASLSLELPDGGDVERDLHVLPGTRVAGRVVGAAGEPVAGAAVRVDPVSYASPPTAVALTDATGAFVLARVSGPGKAKLRVEAAGLLQTDAPEVQLDPGGHVEGIELRMVAAPRITGRVLDAAGAPVAGAQVVVQMSGASPIRVSTDATGSFLIRAACAEGTATITASAGAGAGRIDVTLAADVTGADIALASGVSGRVVFADGAPVAGARIAVHDAKSSHWVIHGDVEYNGREFESAESGRTDAIADADGRFRVSLATGEYLFDASGAGAVVETTPVRVPSNGDVVVTLRRATTLTGSLRDADGTALVGAVAYLEPSPQIGGERFGGAGFDTDAIYSRDHLLLRHTAASGKFAFPGIPEGEYTLVVVQKAPPPERIRQVRFGPLRPSDGPHALSMAAPKTAVIEGRVVDADGAVFRDAKLQVMAVPEAAPSQWGPSLDLGTKLIDCAPDGSFRIEGLTAPRYTVQVWAMAGRVTNPRGTSVWTNVRRRSFHGLRAGQSDAVLQMTEGLAIRGRLVDESGAALANWSVSADSPKFDRTIVAQAARADANGVFVIHDLDDFEYFLRPCADGKAPQRRLVVKGLVRGGADLGDVVATLEARIRGHVVDAKGAACPARVHVTPVAGGVVEQIVADEHGAFEATGLEPGASYRVTAALPDDTVGWTQDQGTQVVAGTSDVRIVRQ